MHVVLPVSFSSSAGALLGCNGEGGCDSALDGSVVNPERSAGVLRWTREFAAPRPLLWEALTQPGLQECWMSGRGWTLVASSVDPQRGGVVCADWWHDEGQRETLTGLMLEVEDASSWEQLLTWGEEAEAAALRVIGRLTEVPQGASRLTVFIGPAETRGACPPAEATLQRWLEAAGDRLAGLLEGIVRAEPAP